MNSVLNELRMDSNRLVLTMLEDKAYNQYDLFSTNRAGVRPIPEPPTNATEAEKYVYDWPSGSVEALHGLYHVMIGGCPISQPPIPGNHMSRVAVAAFDPVFVSRPSTNHIL